MAEKPQNFSSAAADAGYHGDFLHDREYAVRQLEQQVVAVCIGHQAARGALAVHAEEAGVIDADHVRAAALGKLRRDAGTGAGDDDRGAGVDLRLHTGLHFFACILFCHSSVPPHELRVNFGALERRDRVLDRLCTVVHVVDADETDRVGMVIDVLGILRRLYGQTLHED